MTIPTEPIGSLPRPPRLIEAVEKGDSTDASLDQAGNSYLALEDVPDRKRVLKIIRDHLKPDQRAFIGVIWPIQERIETPEEVCAKITAASRYIPIYQLGTTDDCGFSPFSDDTSTTRATAFANIRAWVLGAAMAAREREGSRA